MATKRTDAQKLADRMRKSSSVGPVAVSHPASVNLVTALASASSGEIDAALASELPSLLRDYRRLSQLVRELALVGNPGRKRTTIASSASASALRELIDATTDDILALDNVDLRRLRPIAADCEGFPFLITGHHSGIKKAKTRITALNLSQALLASTPESRFKRDEFGAIAKQIVDELIARLPELKKKKRRLVEVGMGEILDRIFEEHPELQANLVRINPCKSDLGKPGRMVARMKERIRGRLTSLLNIRKIQL
jgi:hypothetical protein